MSSTMSTSRPGEVEVEVLHDADDAGRPGGVAVGRHRHEVELERQVDGPGEVGHEHERALEHADEQRRPAGVVRGDLRAELGDAGLERRRRRRRPRRGRGCRSGAVARRRATTATVPGAQPATVRRRRRTAPTAADVGGDRARLGRRRAPGRRWRRRAGGCSRPVAQPRADRARGPAAAARRPARGRRSGRARARELVEELGVGAQEVGLAGEHAGDVALGDGVEQRQQLVAHAVAAEPRVVVARVVDRLRARGRRTARGSRVRRSRRSGSAVRVVAARGRRGPRPAAG